jgi:hypothetical protein
MTSIASTFDLRSGAKPPSSPTPVFRPLPFSTFLRCVEHFSAHAQCFLEARSAHRHHHEFLHVDVVVGVAAAVEDVHHRDRKRVRVGAANVSVEGDLKRLGDSLGRGEGDTEDCVRAKIALVACAVKLDHRAVDGALIERVHAHELFRDDGVHILHRLLHPLAEVAGGVAVAELYRLVLTGGCTRGHRSAPDHAGG